MSSIDSDIKSCNEKTQYVSVISRQTQLSSSCSPVENTNMFIIKIVYVFLVIPVKKGIVKMTTCMFKRNLNVTYLISTFNYKCVMFSCQITFTNSDYNRMMYM